MANEETIKSLSSAALAAGRRGPDRNAWDEWLDRANRSEIPFDEILPSLKRESLRWLAKYCFATGETELGIAAYTQLLDANWEVREKREPVAPWKLSEDVERHFDRRQSPAWIYSAQAVDFIAAVREVSGPQAAIAAAERVLRFDPIAYPDIQRHAAIIELETNLAANALRRLEPVVQRDHASGSSHEAYARVLAAVGQPQRARHHFIAAAKRGVVPNDSAATRPAEITIAELKRLRYAHALPALDVLETAFVRNPGHTLLPSDDASDTPHIYAGGNIAMPPCPKCDHALTLVAEIEVADAAAHEASLAPLIGQIERLPIVHCRYCQLMFSNPDYALSEDGTSLANFGPPMSRMGNSIFKPARELQRQPARLAAVQITGPDASSVAADIDDLRHSGPQIGGLPRPINQPRRRFCPKCDAEQLFYAAYNESEAFKTPLTINPDGYVYFFICPACRIISTDLDNT